MDSQGSAPSRSPQSHPPYMGGVWPKVPAKPSTGQPQLKSQSGPKEGPDPVNHAHMLIHAKIGSSIRPHWWQEIKAIGSHIVKEGYSNYKAEHYAQCQAVAFRLLATQQEALGWLESPSWLCGLYPQDFITITDTPSPTDLWVMSQEKTLALAQVLQACARESGALTGILCDAP